MYDASKAVLKNPAHVQVSNTVRFDCTVQRMNIKTEYAAQSLNKEMGQYITINIAPLYQLSFARNAGNCLAEVLESVFSPFFEKRLCICGLGNPDSMCDSVGPAAMKLFPAMFLEEVDTCHEGRFSKVATFVPNVTERTNMAVADVVAGLVSATQADCLVLVDAIATQNRQHLCDNIQISTAGGAARYVGGTSIDWDRVGVPTVHIGVPTMLQDKRATPNADGLLTTYRIQEVVSTAAAIIAYALIKVSYPSLSEQNCIEAVQLRQAVF